MLHRSLIAASVAFAFAATPAFAENHQETGHDAAAPGLTKDLSADVSGTYALDDTHASLGWSVSHMGFAFYQGQFTDLEGSLIFDAEDPTKSELSITIATDSVQVQSDVLTEELKGEKGFKAEEFPAITFVSTSIEKTGDDTGVLTGNLTMLGVTKPVELDVRFNGTAPHPINKKQTMGFDAYGSLKRSDFGFTSWTPFVGDRIDIVIGVEFNKAD